ncbi:MAG: tRNA pseudouridine(38-40) synthase TruA [Leptospirillia bacterium]
MGSPPKKRALECPLSQTPSSRRIALLLAYDGRDFSGWQVQPNQRTVQGLLVDALTTLCHTPVGVIGSGRTDAGVSAWGQVAHADLPEGFSIPVDRLPRILNTRLPESLRVLDCRRVPSSFHARHSARGKIYRYVFRRLPVNLSLHPLATPFAAPLPPDFFLPRAREASTFFLGTHDFRHFSVASSLPDDSTRRIDNILWEERPAGVILWVTGPGFLHKMVRMIGRYLLEAGEGHRPLEEIPTLLRKEAPPPFRTVEPLPPEGLALARVLYDTDPFDPRTQTCYPSPHVTPDPPSAKGGTDSHG